MIALSDAKGHLRVTHDDEDGYIDGLVQAAEAHISEYLGEDLPDPMPAPVRAAALLLIGDLFENRERQSDRVLYENTAYALLLNPYRSMGFE